MNEEEGATHDGEVGRRAREEQAERPIKPVWLILCLKRIEVGDEEKKTVLR